MRGFARHLYFWVLVGIALFLFKSHGEAAKVLAFEDFLEAQKTHWLVNEIRHFWKRTLKRIDVTSRTLVA